MMRIVGVELARISAHRAHGIDRVLSQDERRRLEAQPVAHRAEWRAGRVALKLAAAPHCRKPWHRVRTGHDTAGRPCLPDFPRLHCSLSHTALLAVAAVGSLPVGVDVERVRPRSRSLLRYIASADELDLFNVGSTSEQLVTAVWTIKEAALKSGGWGLSIPPRAAEISRRHGRFRFDVKLAWQSVDREITVWNTSVDGCSLSIAWNGPNPLPGIRWDSTFDVPAR